MEAERSQVGIGQFVDGDGNPSNVIGIANVTVGGLNVVVNSSGAAFSGSGASGIGDLNYNTDAFRAFTLLHEFAHTLAIPGFYPEGGAPNQSALEDKNNAQILSHCSKTLAGFKN